MKDLIINYKVFLIFIMLGMFISCKNTSKIERSSLSQIGNDTIRFKSWLKDTVPDLIKNKSSAGSSMFYKVYEDSTLLEITKIYDTVLSKDIRTDNKDLRLAIELLKDNNDLVLDKVNLEFEVLHSYDVSITGRKYDYSLELKKFEVSNSNKKFIYNYIKGNLIDKKEIDIPTKP